MSLTTDQFNFPLPPELIAQSPAPQRDQSRLLVLNRNSGALLHERAFSNLPHYLTPGDVLVLNDSRVFPARLRGRKLASGGEIEILLLTELERNQWWTLLRPGKRVRAGTRIVFEGPGNNSAMEAVVLEKNAEGHCRLEFMSEGNIRDLLEQIGELPLPPYIERSPQLNDRERYQTVFARQTGSIAAPTAGLHFTGALLDRLGAAGIEIHYVTLHVGLGTFAPVKAARVQSHRMHEEQFSLGAETAGALNTAIESGRRIIAVGTTTVRVLESVAAANQGGLVAAEGKTHIYIYPPFQFKIVKGLLTNFHLPRSTLLMLVSAFAAPGEERGRELILRAYAEAVREKYRFFSYGDAMLLL